MEIIPAIDLLGGRAVRLRQGRYDDVTVYDSDPVDRAGRFQREGARALHVVDLDGARDGRPGNLATIERIVQATSMAVQVGGGIRDAEAAQAWIDLGARVVLGTAAIESPEVVGRICERAPDRVIIALDAKAGEVVTRGWVARTGRKLVDVAREVDGWGVSAILFTSVERDGTGQGPDVQATADLQQRVGTKVIASGGIGDLAHVVALAQAGVRAAVCGKALYAGAFTLAQAFEAASATIPVVS